MIMVAAEIGGSCLRPSPVGKLLPAGALRRLACGLRPMPRSDPALRRD